MMLVKAETIISEAMLIYHSNIPSLIFITLDGTEENIISQHQLAKVPSDVLQKLLTGHEGDVGGSSMHNIGPTAKFSSFVRLKQFLKSGTYQPFSPTVTLKVLDSRGAEHVWDPKKQIDGVQGLAHSSFVSQFCRELDLYDFAAELNYTALIAESSKNIRKNYPIGKQETEKLAERTLKEAQGCKDEDLTRFILEQAKKFNVNVAADTSGILASTLSDKPLEKLLLEAHDVAPDGAFDYLARAGRFASEYNVPELQTFLRDLAMSGVEEVKHHPTFRNTIREAVQHQPLAKLLVDSRLGPDTADTASPAAEADAFLAQIPVTEHVDNIKPELPDTPVSNTGSLQLHTSTPDDYAQSQTTAAAFIFKLENELHNGNIYVADQGGFGTLWPSGNSFRSAGRNEDFRFQRGELLLKDTYRRASNGYRNVVVINSHGQVGDVLETLLKRVDERLARQGRLLKASAKA